MSEPPWGPLRVGGAQLWDGTHHAHFSEDLRQQTGRPQCPENVLAVSVHQTQLSIVLKIEIIDS